MKNEKLIRLLVFIFAAALHVVIIMFLAINTEQNLQEEEENARIMKLTDLDEIPPPPPQPDPEIPQVEEIAETVIETDEPPVQIVVPAATITTPPPPPEIITTEEDYLPAHMVSQPARFDEAAIAKDLLYPPIARNSGIEGRVILDLFIDRTGVIQRAVVLREEPEGRSFGEAAVRAFIGKKGQPALANGEPVSMRMRYPVVFRLTGSR